MSDDLTGRILKVICEVKEGVFDAEQLGLEKSFRKDLDFDSLDVAQLMLKLEETFEKEGLGEIPQEEVESVDTVGDLIAYIQKKLPPGACEGNGQGASQ